MKLFRYLYRSAVTGRFVTADYAKAHPAETMRVRVWFWQNVENVK